MCTGIHGDGGGGVVETDVAGADSHPSNVAVRVAAKAAFDVFEAVWPKHATTWVEEGMEPRWRRLVTHGSLETPEESGAYARGGYPAVGRRESAPLADHRREEKFAERQRIKDAANRSGVRDPDASDDVDARRLTMPGNFQDGKLPFQPPYPPLPTKPKHGLRERAMHPPQPQPKPLWTGDPPSPVKRAIDADIEKDIAARNKPLAAYYEAVRERGSMSAKECGDFIIDPNDITKTAEEAMLYRDLEKLETRMETLRANSMGARVYDMYAEAYYRPGALRNRPRLAPRRRLRAIVKLRPPRVGRWGTTSATSASCNAPRWTRRRWVSTRVSSPATRRTRRVGFVASRRRRSSPFVPRAWA